LFFDGLSNIFTIKSLPLQKNKYLMGLHCILIVKLQISGNWKKQLQRTRVLVISFKDQFKSEKVNHFHESSGLTGYNVYNPKRLDTVFEISYCRTLEQLSKGQPQFLFNSNVRN
tara:strand:- start:331 stop:672 length:342 start_codon:yes stop_codon:yes gene_type:complete